MLKVMIRKFLIITIPLINALSQADKIFLFIYLIYLLKGNFNLIERITKLNYFRR